MYHFPTFPQHFPHFPHALGNFSHNFQCISQSIPVVRTYVHAQTWVNPMATGMYRSPDHRNQLGNTLEIVGKISQSVGNMWKKISQRRKCEKFTFFPCPNSREVHRPNSVLGRCCSFDLLLLWRVWLGRGPTLLSAWQQHRSRLHRGCQCGT